MQRSRFLEGKSPLDGLPGVEEPETGVRPHTAVRLGYWDTFPVYNKARRLLAPCFVVRQTQLLLYIGLCEVNSGFVRPAPLLPIDILQCTAGQETAATITIVFVCNTGNANAPPPCTLFVFALFLGVKFAVRLANGVKR